MGRSGDRTPILKIDTSKPSEPMTLDQLVSLVEALREFTAQTGTFEGRLQMLAIEPALRELVEADDAETPAATELLEGISLVRVAIAAGDAERAAADAMHLGRDLARLVERLTVRELRAGQRRGGRKTAANTAAQRMESKAKLFERIETLRRRWRLGESLRDAHTTELAYLAHELGYTTRHVRRLLGDTR